MRGALPDRVLSREGHAVAAVREGNLAYGVLPFTVAGPRPVCTALPHFPSLQDCRFSLRSRRRSVNETAEPLTNPLTGEGAESMKRLRYSFHSLVATRLLQNAAARKSGPSKVPPLHGVARTFTARKPGIQNSEASGFSNWACVFQPGRADLLVNPQGGRVR
jgi:hypothetical protein